MKVFIETLGCPKNKEDSERIAGLLARGGHSLVFSAAEADAIVVNTCAFVEDAKKESIEAFFEYVPLKEQGKKLFLAGCLAQRYGGELAKELPEADGIFGVNDYYELAKKLKETASSGLPRSAKASLAMTPTILQGERVALEARHSSYIKIAEGCDNHCAYCVIPDIRGPYRSVPEDVVLEEAKVLASEGCKELIVIAQDTTNYGANFASGGCDTGVNQPNLSELLQKLCKTDGIEWLRLLYAYEERVTDGLIEALAGEPKICKYIDLPLQHISAGVLSRMGRRSTPDSIRNTIGRLRKAMPEIVIRTTFITGFPGESESEFAELLDFVEEEKFGRVGVFAYSREEGTPAAEMAGQIPHEVAEERKEELMRRQLLISRANNEKLVGRVLDVITDEFDDREGYFVGRSRGDAPEIDNAVLFTVPPALKADKIIGEIVKVRVNDALDYDLVGELAS